MTVELAQLEATEIQAGLEALLAPDATEWESAAEIVVPLEPTPLERQPSAYVQASWRDRPHGGVGEVRVRAARGEGALAVRLDWAAARPQRLISDVSV